MPNKISSKNKNDFLLPKISLAFSIIGRIILIMSIILVFIYLITGTIAFFIGTILLVVGFVTSLRSRLLIKQSNNSLPSTELYIASLVISTILLILSLSIILMYLAFFIIFSGTDGVIR
ncbi:hypothetical protein COU57_04120 [Candidatus Pacearchaeota archaeon CG10_big_fil_rev_8_21_14_0_10_32_14]|nr:MAG: hypothetical protein COU57_04120 [Candidatus Pacearchaeota archaeon CG10_big_fil_rev_8_21_14_0_10_32_14]